MRRSHDDMPLDITPVALLRSEAHTRKAVILRHTAISRPRATQVLGDPAAGRGS